ncbi:MAG: type II secretion system major pseudopilin GspG [Planctomycetes bacterium]|nr:type II secretion system major pseudopilin GspG [Planctomycetota bacterium]
MKTFLHTSRRAARRGFSLAEMMVVIVIIGLLATLVIPNVMDKFRAAGVEKAKTDITSLINALNEYAIRNAGKYPESLEVLVTPDQNGYRYLQAQKVPKDPWKQEYSYEPPTGSGNQDPHVWSYGKDGQPGGEDDIDSRTMNDS